MNWLTHALGLDNGSGPIYLAWSGAGADLGELAIIGGLVTHYRRMTCHVDTPRFCWRPGVHPVAGTPYKTCKKHHPSVPDEVSAEHIETAYREASS